MSVIINFQKLPVLDIPIRKWECPSCGHQHLTKDQRIITPMHPCPKLKGIMAPYVEVKGNELRKHTHTHRVIEREEYQGKEKGLMKDDEGKVVMAVHTEREDGHDTAVFPGVGRVLRD